MRYWIDFKQLRSELDFVKVLEHFNVKLKPRGQQLVGVCPLPLHQSDRKSESFSANIERGIFQCFSCHAKGNALDFAVLMENRDLKNGDDIRKTGIELAKAFGLQSADQGLKRKVETPKPAPSQPVATLSPAKQGLVAVNPPLDFELKDLEYNHPYLKDRGFSPEIIKEFGLGYCARGYFQNRVVIPIHNAEGRLIGYAGRIVDDNLINDETPRYLFPGKREHNGVSHEFRKTLVLYNAHRITAPVHNLIIVEGFTSVWWLKQLGFRHVVAAMGDSISEFQATEVKRLATEFARLWIIGDGDKAGGVFSAKVGDALCKERLTLQIRLPPDLQPTGYCREYFECMFGKPATEM